MSVVVFHSMVAPHVQQAARTLYEAGQLERFVTSIHDAPTSLRQKILTAVGGLLRLDMRREFSKRAVTEIPIGLVEGHPWSELLRIAVARLDRDQRLSDALWERTELAFDRKAAASLRPGLTGVYGFEYGSLATFRRARELGARIGYEMPAPDPRFVQSLLEREMNKFPALKTPYQKRLAAKQRERAERRAQEWELADVIVAASQFTRNSYGSAGFSVEKVKVLPLGAPPALDPSAAISGGTPSDRSLDLIWAGTFSVRKGAHYLLDAWRRGQFGRHVRLRIYGSSQLPPAVMNPVPAGVEFCGSIPRADLLTEFDRSDALLFPTLCDGFGMVATEAWSRGLPVITTDCAGAADLLKPRENGLLIRAGETAALVEAIEWCLSHRAELRAMRTAAAATAASWQWADYRRGLAKLLEQARLFPAA